MVKGDLFQRRKLVERGSLHDVLRNEEVIFQSSKKENKNGGVFSLARDVVYWKIRCFLRQKVNGDMMFTGDGKFLVLNFSGMGNMVFF